LATLEAVLFCKEVDFFYVLFEDDAKQVVLDMNSAMQGLRWGSFTHVGREANNVAHFLAKVASSKETNSTWLEDIPSFLLPVILRDYSSS